MACVSAASLRGVPVPWATMQSTSSGARPEALRARRVARAAASPEGAGAVMGEGGEGRVGGQGRHGGGPRSGRSLVQVDRLAVGDDVHAAAAGVEDDGDVISVGVVDGEARVLNGLA